MPETPPYGLARAWLRLRVRLLGLNPEHQARWVAARTGLNEGLTMSVLDAELGVLRRAGLVGWRRRDAVPVSTEPAVAVDSDGVAELNLEVLAVQLARDLLVAESACRAVLAAETEYLELVGLLAAPTVPA